MKKIYLSLAAIGVVAAVVVGVTTAFFSDSEISTGNTFTAGAIDLKVDSNATFNGQPYQAGTWGQTPDGKDIVDEKFFNFADVKPGDSGEDTVSLHVINNDAYICAAVSNLANNDNGLTEPEAKVDSTDGVGNGELQNNLMFTIWRDDGDNIQETGETTLLSGPAVNGELALYDSTTLPAGPLLGGTTGYLGVSWSLPIGTGNEVQTDSMTGDIGFTVVQARNNSGFVCGQQGPTPETRNISLENKNAQWQILSNDQIFGLIQYSHNDTTFHGVVTGTGLVPGGKYQITLNGPVEASGTCGFTNLSLGNFAGGNTFKGGFWNSAAPNLSPTCTGGDEEGLYNMNLIGDHYTFIADGSGAFNYPFSLSLPTGSYHGVKVLVKKMLDTHISPWADTGAGYPMFNLYETASIDFTILP